MIEAYDLRRVEPAPRNQLQYEPVTEMYRGGSPHDITLIRKDNGGRADALNAGLDVARHPYVCVTDADSIIDPDGAVRHGAAGARGSRARDRRRRHDPRRQLVAGRVGPRHGAAHADRARWPRYQVIEYLRAFLFGRVAWDAIGALVIVSGAFGLFRRDVVDEVGGYWADTVGEDLELTVRLHRHMRDQRRPYRITFAPDPVCWTEAPSDMATLGSQRRRWHRGLWECLWRHRSMMLRRRYGAPGMLALPYFLVFEFGEPADGGRRLDRLPDRPRPRLIDVRLVFAVHRLLVGASARLSRWSPAGSRSDGYRNYRRGRDLGRMFVLAVFENIWFRQLIDFYRLAGVYDIARRKQGWGAMKRRGFETT